MLSINTNLSSIIAQHSMNSATAKLDQAIERMTTGYKINHAKDNAANYSITTNMTTKMNSYMVAQDNAEMGMDMVTTAEENLSQMGAHAKRLRELATQARNGTYGKQSLQAMQEEANTIYSEINRLYQTAEYNGVKLFNQSEYDLLDTMPKADPITGFIEDPYDYTEEDLENITSIAKVKNNTFEESTYKIETVADLAKLAELTNAGVDTTGKTFVLANDLDLKEYCENHKDEGGWTPIGTETNEFKGTFNGNGNVISNLTIERNEGYQGLFGGTLNGIVKNIGIDNASIDAKGYTGALIGHSRSIISNCYILNSNINGHGGWSGGLSGFMYGSTKNSYVNSSSIKGAYAGGLFAGYTGDLENCFANTFTTANYRGGGLVGYLSGNVSNCYTNSDISGNNHIGGAFGEVYCTSSSKTIKISNVISNSKVKCKGVSVGSFIGSVVLTKDNINWGNVEISSCLSKSQPNMNMIKSCYQYTTDGRYLEKKDYDISPWLTNIEELKIKTITTNLQVGIKAESASQIDFDTNFELDLGKIVRNGIRSDSALSAIDDFIDVLSTKETELGAVSNRLESVLDEIEIQYNNLASSRSTIRDADIAEVTSDYIKMQIL